MIRLAIQIPLAALVCAAASAQTASLTTSSFAPGVPQTSSANYTIDSALDPSGGPAVTSTNYTLKPSYIGQLYDVASLDVTAQQVSVNELATNQLEAAATMDDDTTLPLAATDVAWSVLSGPLSSISPAGVAQTSAVFTDTLATARGEYLSLLDDAFFTVLDALPDNFGPVDGDGLDDEWQFAFFDEDNNNALDPTEAANAAPGSDPDMDGQENSFEILSGYDPTDGASFFTFSIVGRTGMTATLELSKVIPGTLYDIRKATALGPGDPFGLIDTVSSPVEDLGHQTSDPAATEDAAFYRVELRQAP